MGSEPPEVEAAKFEVVDPRRGHWAACGVVDSVSPRCGSAVGVGSSPTSPLGPEDWVLHLTQQPPGSTPPQQGAFAKQLLDSEGRVPFPSASTLCVFEHRVSAAETGVREVDTGSVDTKQLFWDEGVPKENPNGER